MGISAQGCVGAVWNNPEVRSRSQAREGLPAPEGGTNLSVSLSSLSETANLSWNQSTRKVQVSGITYLYPQVLTLKMGSVPLSFSSCSGSTAAQIIQQRIIFRPAALIPEGSVPTTVEFSCSTTEGSQYDFQISLDAPTPSTVLSIREDEITHFTGSFVNSHEGIRFSRDHRFVLYTPTGGRLTSKYPQVVKKNLDTGTIQVVSTTASGVWGNGPSQALEISDDGRYVYLKTSASNLIGSAPSAAQIIRKDTLSGAVSLVSQNSDSSLSGVSEYLTSLAGDGLLFYFSCSCFTADGTSSQVYKKSGSSPLVKVSTLQDGTPLSDASNPKVTSSGRFLVFESLTDAVLGDPAGATQIYRKDLQTGEIIPVSTDSSDSTLADLTALNPQISDDGTLVFFHSDATNLSVGPNSSVQIFRKDLNTSEIKIVSASHVATQSGFADLVDKFRISSDGNLVFALLSPFSSLAPWLAGYSSASPLDGVLKNISSESLMILGSTNGVDHDGLDEGLTQAFLSESGQKYAFTTSSTDLNASVKGHQLYRGVVGSPAEADLEESESLLPLDDSSYHFESPILVRDPDTGQLEAIFATVADNLFSGIPIGALGKKQIIAKNLTTGQLELLSTSDGSPSGASLSDCYLPDATPDGDKVVFLCAGGSDLVTSNPLTEQVFYLDRQTGILRVASTESGSASTHIPSGDISIPRLSENGRYVLFSTTSGGLVPGDTFATGVLHQLFRKDLQTETVTLVSSDDGTSAKRANNHCNSDSANFSADGNVIVFSCNSTANAAADAGSVFVQASSNYQVYVLDLSSGRSLNRVSVKSGLPGNATSTFASISSDGAVIALISRATNLTMRTAPGISNEVLRYRRTDPIGTFTLLSGDSSGNPLSSANSCWGLSPILNEDGTSIVFKCRGTLQRNTTPSTSDQVFLWTEGSDLRIISSEDSEQGEPGQDDSTPGGFVEFAGASWILFNTQSLNLHQLPADLIGTGSVPRLILQKSN